MARAIFKDSKIIVLDEPTAALDPLSEYQLYKDFASISEKQTAIYISHRLSSCRFCHKIAVFHNSDIIEYGSHDELMKQNGFYERMFSEQAQLYKG